MKRICKKYLKDTFLYVLVMILIFQFVMPNFVSAYTTSEATMTYKEWCKDAETPEIQADNRKYQIKQCTIEKIAKLEGDFVVNGQTLNFTGEDGRAKATAMVENESMQDKITIRGKLIVTGQTYRFEIYDLKIDQDALNEFEGTQNYTYDEYVSVAGEDRIKDFIKRSHYQYESASLSSQEREKIDKEIDQIIEEYKDKMTIRAKGSEDDYKIEDIIIEGYEWNTISSNMTFEEEQDEDEADLGGILLSPVFYLINFIADAITSNLGRIMIGNDASFANVTGTKILQDATIPLDSEKKYHEEEANMESNLIGTIQYPNIPYTPEEIFAGKIDLLSIDFISGKNYEGEENSNDGWINIRKVVSQWYQVLRMIAIIGLLSVLIYTGIKIIISANAKDKAKFKEWIINWLMAVAILFFMHYIMAFIISVTGEFSKLISQASQGIAIVNDGEKSATNLMGLVRFMIQSEDFYIKVAYEVMYIALIVYTIKFTFIYLKRVLNMAFLTLIAPIVALTYPIDKINDGKAQGFDMWLKEYIFNALLQPMHCILYYVLVGSAVSIAATNPIYGIVVLMFMTEAEKLLKKIFGFDKAGGGTVGGMANAFAAGAIASNLSRMVKLPKGNAGKSGSGNSEAENELFKNLKPTDKKHEKDDALFIDNEKDFVDNEKDSERPETKKESEDAVTLGRKSTRGDQRGEWTSSGYKISPANSEQTNKDSDDKNTVDKNNSNKEEPKKQMVADKDSPDKRKPAKQMAKEKSKFARGMGNVGKKLLKPVWDLDHKGEEGNKYNRKRLRRKIGRAALGVGLGIGAAAVQAGISITDGKYNALEGVASFTAGYAGGGQLASGFRSLEDAYKEGTLSDSPKERKEQLMARAKEKWTQRDDVIKHNKNKYEPGERDAVMEIQKQLLEQGVTDIKEMDDCIKYIRESNNKSLQGVTPDIVRKSRVMHDFTGDSNVKKVMFDPSKRKDYINAIATDDRERKILENKFNEAIKYNNIVNQN